MKCAPHRFAYDSMSFDDSRQFAYVRDTFRLPHFMRHIRRMFCIGYYIFLSANMLWLAGLAIIIYTFALARNAVALRGVYAANYSL